MANDSASRPAVSSLFPTASITVRNSTATTSVVVVMTIHRVGLLTKQCLFTDVQMIKGLTNIFAGGEGLFMTTLTGPGVVWLQGQPADRMIKAIASRVPSGGGVGFAVPVGGGSGGGGSGTGGGSSSSQ
jgi:uncharacterized membrane protein YgcG